VDARGCTLCVTCAPFTPGHLTACLDEIAFEEFGFGALQRVPGPVAAGALYHAQAAEAQAEAAASATAAGGPARAHGAVAAAGSLGSGGEYAALVVDLGYSCTYAVPMVRGVAVQGAVRRLNVGGRLLTALLQETVSFRQYNMMDEVSQLSRLVA
jgi:actin-related protein 6